MSIDSKLQAALAATGRTPDRPLYQIADDINKHWHPVNYAAKPYLEAMSSLGTMADSYGFDSASGIVAYFLANAGTWRGEDARRIKKELKEMLTEYQNSKRRG